MGRFDRLIERFQLFPDRHVNGNGKAVATVEAADASPVETKSYPGSGVTFVGPHTGRLTYIGGQPTSELEEVDRYTAFAAAAYCFVALRYRALKVSEAPLMVGELTDDGVEQIRPHAADRILRWPSRDFSMAKLLRRTRTYRDIGGMALWIGNRSRGGELARMTPFPAHDILRIEPEGDRIYGRFHVQLRGGPRWFSMERDDLVFWVEDNPGDWYTGLSLVDVMLSMLNLAQSVRATARSLLENAVFPSLVIQTDPEWDPSDTEWERFKAEISAHAQLANKGRPLSVTGGGRATVVSAKIADLVPGELMDRIEATVAAVSGIPAVVLQYLVGLKNSPWSQMEQAHRQAAVDTIEPIWRDDEDELTRQLLPKFDEDPNHVIRFDRRDIAALRPDDQKLAEVVAKLEDVWTVDEARIYTGQEPLKDAKLGAQIISHAKPSKQAAPASTPEDGSAVADSEKARRSSRLQTKDATRWQRFDLSAKAQEESWLIGVSAQLDRDRAAVLAIADRIAETEKSGKALGDTAALGAIVKQLIAEIEAWAALARGDWRAVVDPLIRSTGRAGLRALAADIGISFDLLIPGIETYTEQHAAHLVTQITDTTRSAIARTLRIGLANGENMDALRKRIEDGDAAFGESRAELIARTETVGVTNGAQLQGMREYAAANPEAQITKTWLATDDERTRDSHEQLNGRQIALDGVFENGAKYPGDPDADVSEVANCRCTLTYAIEFAEEAA